MDDQEDIDSAAEHQQMQDEQQHRENSGVMDSRCFTKPMPPFPRLTPQEQFDVDMAQLRAIDFALRRLWRE